MAFLSSSMTSGDKEFFSSLTPYDDLFDQFVDSDSYGLSDNTTDQSASDEWDKYFDIPESLTGSDTLGGPSQHMTHKRARANGCGGTAISPELPGCSSPAFNSQEYWAQAGTSDDGLFSNLLDFSSIDCHTSSPSSSPAFSKPRAPKHIKTTSNDLLQTQSGGIRKTSSKAPSSPHMAQPSVCRDRGEDDTWARRIEDEADRFDFTIPSHLASPPTTAPLPQMSWNSNAFQSNAGARAPSGSGDMLDEFGLPHFSPLTSPVLNTQVAPGTSYNTRLPSNTYFTAPYSPRDLEWSFTNSGPSLPNTTSYSSTPYYLNRNSQTTHTQTGMRSAPLPSLHTTQGLMMNCDTNIVPSIERDPVYCGVHISHTRSQSDNLRQNRFITPTSTRQPSFLDAPYNPSQQSFPQIQTMRIRRPPTPPTSHPSSSRRARSRSRSRKDSRSRARSQSRGPNTLHRRAKSSINLTQTLPYRNKQPGTFLPPSNTGKGTSGVAPSSTSGSGSGSGGGFVNYTPSDSRKILTGVAPSGSSKTKARREKEAIEKRRKLSLAAARAVLEAGGDSGALDSLDM